MEEDEEYQRKSEEPENDCGYFIASDRHSSVIQSFQLSPGCISVKFQSFTAKEQITEATEEQLCAECNDHREQFPESSYQQAVHQPAGASRKQACCYSNSKCCSVCGSSVN